jgi:integrase
MPQAKPKRSERELEPIVWRGHKLFRRGASSYVVRVVMPDGRRVQRSAPTPKAAIALRDELRAARARGDYRAESPITLAQFTREWLRGYRGRSRGGVRDATVESYDDDLRLHVLPTLGSMRLAAMRPVHVDRLVGELAAGTAKSEPGFKRRPLSPGSVQRAIAPLRAALADAVRAELIPSNPCAGLRLAGKRQGDDERPALEPSQIAALLDAAPEGLDRCLLRLLVETGLRISEAIGLTWADLDLAGERPELRVRRAIVDGVAGEPKSAYGRREVPLRPQLIAELAASSWRAATRVTPTPSLPTCGAGRATTRTCAGGCWSPPPPPASRRWASTSCATPRPAS